MASTSLAEKFFAQLTRRSASSSQQARGGGAILLHRLHNAWRDLLIDRAAQSTSESFLQLENTDIPVHLRLVVDTLVSESNAQALSTQEVGLCLGYTLKNQCLLKLVDVSELDFPRGFRGEVIKTCAALVTHLDSGFLLHNAAHRAIIKLNKSCATLHNTSDYQPEVTELLYAVCEKIHRLPKLLWVFFNEQRLLSPLDITQDTYTIESPIQQQQRCYSFPIFSFLLRFIHDSHSPGEFARTAIINILEMATGTLREYILEDTSFFVTVSAILGALYAELPTQLTSTAHVNISSQSTNDKDRNSITPSSSSPPTPLHPQLDAYLRYVNFVQQIISRCPSAAISLSLLSYIHQVFLKSILQPSLTIKLESDIDLQRIETTVFYLDQTLSVLTSDDTGGGPLVKLIIDFLLDGGYNRGTLLNSTDVLRVETYVENHYYTNIDSLSPTSAHAVDLTLSRSYSDLKSLLCHPDVITANQSELVEIITTNELSNSMEKTSRDDNMRNVLLTVLRLSFTRHWQLLANDDKDQESENVQLIKSTLTLVLSTLQFFRTMITLHWKYTLPRLLPNISILSSFIHDNLLATKSDYEKSQLTLSDLPHEIWAQPIYTERWSGVRVQMTNVARYTTILANFHALFEQDEFMTHASSYEAYLRDAEQSIHLASPTLQSVNTTAFTEDSQSPQENRSKPSAITPPIETDEFLIVLFDLLYRWFTNPPSLNLVLAGVLSALSRTPVSSVYIHLYAGDQQFDPLSCHSTFIYPWLMELLREAQQMTSSSHNTQFWSHDNSILLMECIKELVANLVVQGYANETVCHSK